MQYSIKCLIVFIFVMFCSFAKTQIITFRPVDPSAARSAPRINITFMNDPLFKSGTNRQYVFGGYVRRNWDLVIKPPNEPYMGQYPIMLEHLMCGSGYYSTQMRLDNPPHLEGTETGVWNDMKFDAVKNKARSHYQFKVSKNRAANPCCPFSDAGNKCCKKWSTDISINPKSWGESFEDKFVAQTWDCSVARNEPPRCDNMYDGNNRCLKIGVSIGFANLGAYDKLVRTAQFQAPPALDGNCGRCRVSKNILKWVGDIQDDGVPGKSTTDFERIKMFCYEDNRNMNAFWGPVFETDPPIAGKPLTKTHDMFWNKAQQCKSCTRFGMLYYSTDQFNSICLKVGPGEAAKPDATGVVRSGVSANQFQPVVNPKNNKGEWICDDGKPCTTFYTSQWKIIINKPENKTVGTLQVRGERILGNGLAKPFLNFDIDISGPENDLGSKDCKFDVYSDYLRNKKIRKATKCKISTPIPIKWPSTCAAPYGSGTNECSVIASKVNTDSAATRVPAGTGDARLFARVKLGTEMSGIQDEEAGMKYYENNVFQGLLWVESDKDVEYELAVMMRSSTDLGCGRGISQEDDYNTFTYYYPVYGNYNLESVGLLTWVDSYKSMVQEQRNVMKQLKTLSGTSDIPRMPVGHSAQVAECFQDREGICKKNSQGDDRYEGLPSQDSAFAASARGGVATPRWPDSLYFSDFPNYDANDVEAGWLDAVDAYGNVIPPPSLLTDMKNPSSTQVLRAAAKCIRCNKGYEGARFPSFTDATKSHQTGRFIRAMLGPNGKKYVPTLGIRTTPEEYAKVCTPCLPGSYNARPGGSCKRCRAGTFSMPARQFTPGGERIPAFYADKAPMRCWACLKGFMCPLLGKESFSVCDVSKYGNMCPCPLNTYQDERGQSSCKKCPTDYATAQVGSTSKSDCKRGGVPPGFRFKGPYSQGDDIGGPNPPSMQHVACEKGTYSSYTRLYSPTSIICATCGPGTFAPNKGSTYCYPCPLGQYNNQTGASTCKLCQCTLCGTGPNVNVLVNAQKTTCTQAPIDTFSSNYDDDNFTECKTASCTTPYRSIEENECGRGNMPPLQSRQLQMACMESFKEKMVIQNPLRIASEDELSKKSDSENPGAGKMDIITIVVVGSLLPMLFVALLINSL